MPFEYTYAPLVPGLTATIARLLHVSAAHAFQIVSGGVYCLGPVTLFLMAWQVTRRVVWSFIAGVVYSLSSASELLLPDSGYGLDNLRLARRLYVCFVWDELPHQLGLALVCLAVLFLARAIRDRKASSFVWAGAFVSLSLLASAFGATALLLFAGCLLASNTVGLKRNILLASISGFLGYLAMCPYLPPSLILAIRRNSQLFPDMAWTSRSLLALGGAAAVGALIWFISRHWRAWYMRFFLLAAYLSFVIPALEIKWHLHFVPQPQRYKVELELALVLLTVFGVALLVDRLPRIVPAALALAALWPAYQQVIFHESYSQNEIRPVDITQTIEYQMAGWVGANLPGWRIMAPGSIAQWLNTFSQVPQFAGGSFPTAPNRLQMGVWRDLISSGDAVVPPIWYKAYGVDAAIVAGRDSPEFWRAPYDGHQFDGRFPLLWEERDTRIYEVPRRARTLAHAVSPDALVSRTPAAVTDTAQLERYVAAIEGPAARPAAFRWLQDSRAHIDATLGANEVLSVQITYHPGWTAKSASGPIPIASDALGQIVLRPGRPGKYDIDLRYGADWEGILCRLLSAITVIGTAIFVCRLFWMDRRSLPGRQGLVAPGQFQSPSRQHVEAPRASLRRIPRQKLRQIKRKVAFGKPPVPPHGSDRGWALLAVYGVLLIWLAGLLPFWLDEVLTLAGAAKPTLHELMAWVALNPGSTPLGFLVERPFVEAMGLSRLAARLPSILFSLLSAMSLVGFARDLRLSTKMTLLVLAAYLALPAQLRYAVEARPYSEGLFFTIAGLWCLWRLMQRPTSNLAAAYALIIAAGLYTQPFTVFVQVGALLALAFRSERKALLTAAAALGAGCLLFAPWYVGARSLWQQDIANSQFALTPRSLIVLIREISGGGYWQSIPLLLGACLGWREIEPRVRRFLLGGILFGIVGAMAADAASGYFFATRQTLFVIPALVLLAAAGFASSRRRWLGAALAAVFVIASIVKSWGYFHSGTEDWPGAARAILAEAHKGACIVVPWPEAEDVYAVFEPELRQHFCTASNASHVAAIAETHYSFATSLRDTAATLTARGFHAEGETVEPGGVRLLFFRR